MIKNQGLNLLNCKNNPCLNNGICFEKNERHICFCPPGYAGEKCEFEFKMHINVCILSSPCKNGAKCIPLKNE